ncbi:MAG: hypothetical protein WA970_02900 [Gammaproteobacteria bacterium]
MKQTSHRHGTHKAKLTQFFSNDDFTKLVNRGSDLGVALPDIQSDEDLVLQSQNVQAGAFGGDGGSDNVKQNISV